MQIPYAFTCMHAGVLSRANGPLTAVLRPVCKRSGDQCVVLVLQHGVLLRLCVNLHVQLRVVVAAHPEALGKSTAMAQRVHLVHGVPQGHVHVRRLSYSKWLHGIVVIVICVGVRGIWRDDMRKLHGWHVLRKLLIDVHRVH